MVDVVRVKPPEQVRGAAVSARSGRIPAFQPEEELPLQTRCRCSGPSYIGQPQVAGFASPHYIRRTIDREPKKPITPAKGGAAVGEPSECARTLECF